MATRFYSSRLRSALVLFQHTVLGSCPGSALRLTLSPSNNLDVLIEIDLPGSPMPATMTALGEGLGAILAEGYTVHALVREGRGLPVRVSDSPAQRACM